MVTTSRPASGPPPDPQAVAAWLKASCARAGVAVQVTDPLALRRISVLLGGEPGERPRQAKRAARPRGPSLQPPDRRDSTGVGASASPLGGGPDHQVVDDGPDDGGLPAEVEPGPALP